MALSLPGRASEPTAPRSRISTLRTVSSRPMAPAAPRPAVNPVRPPAMGAPAPAPVAAPAPALTSANVSRINPATDLRSTQILPQQSFGPSAATAAMSAGYQQSVRGLQDAANRVPTTSAQILPGAFAPAGGTSQVRGLYEQQLGKLANAPDRAQLASDAFNLIQSRGDPGYQQALRAVGQKAAALGRTGSGMTTNELTDVFSQRQRDLDLTRRELANQAAGQTLGDRLSVVGALGGGMGDLLGFDTTVSGERRLDRDEQRGERGYQQALAQQGFENRLAASGAMGTATDRLFGLDRDTLQGRRLDREEARGERGYQQGASQQALENRIREATLQDALQGSSFSRAAQMANLGFGNTPTSALMGASGQNAAGSAAGAASAADLLGQWAYDRARPQLPTGPIPVPNLPTPTLNIPTIDPFRRR